MSLKKLIELSNRYGGNAEYVLAGGGNTSYKDESYLHVKRSGAALAGITTGGFVKIDRAKLGRVFSAAYPEEPQAREAAVLRDMLAARCAGEEQKRPSVEALLHHAMPFAYVLHIHPARANGLTCGRNGEAAMRALFPGQALWIPQTMPGYILAKEARQRILDHQKKGGRPPRRLFLENHGVFIGGDTVEDIDAAVAGMEDALAGVIVRTPDFATCEFDKQKAVRFARAVENLAARRGFCVFHTNRELAKALSSREAFSRVRMTFTPDHLVYCGAEGLFIASADLESACSELAEKTQTYEMRHRRLPNIIGLRDTGIYARGESQKEADAAMALFLDALKIAVYAESFGGAKPMEPRLADAIGNWEAERFRKHGYNSI